MGNGVVDKGLVQRLLHQRERGDSREFDPSRREKEVLFVGRPCEESHTAELTVDLAPIIKHRVGVGDDWW